MPVSKLYDILKSNKINLVRKIGKYENKNTIVITLVIVSIIVLISICMPTKSYAGDSLYHFMQAHQDYIVVAKVINKK